MSIILFIRTHLIMKFSKIKEYKILKLLLVIG